MARNDQSHTRLKSAEKKIVASEERSLRTSAAVPFCVAPEKNQKSMPILSVWYGWERKKKRRKQRVGGMV